MVFHHPWREASLLMLSPVMYILILDTSCLLCSVHLRIWNYVAQSMMFSRLTHWGWDKMAAVLQATLSNAFSWMKMLELRLIFHWSLFLRVQLTIFQHWFRWWLGAGEATSHYLNQWWLVYWRIYASLGLNELISALFKLWFTCCSDSWLSLHWLVCDTLASRVGQLDRQRSAWKQIRLVPGAPGNMPPPLRPTKAYHFVTQNYPTRISSERMFKLVVIASHTTNIMYVLQPGIIPPTLSLPS